MSRHAHDRAGAVAHQDVISDPDRNLFAVRRIDRERAGEHAGLFLGEVGAFEIGFRCDPARDILSRLLADPAS